MHGVCELRGLDPLYLANEGKLVAVVPPESAQRALAAQRGHPYGEGAMLLGRALHELAPPRDSVVMIENVGNLVCPALFELGERVRVVILSVTEGEDKPLKYPHMFRRRDLLLVNKADLLPHVAFDVERCVDYARRLNPAIDCLTVSAVSGHNLARWYGWLRAQAAAARNTVTT